MKSAIAGFADLADVNRATLRLSSPVNFHTNFKLVPWESVASAFTPALAITPSGHDPRAPVNRLAPRFDGLVRESNGTVRLSLSGATGSAYALQSSTNLTQWNLVTNLTFATSILNLTNAPSAVTPQFYRIVAP